MSQSSDQKPLRIDVVSDIVCPWCFIGKARLEKALALKPEIPVEVHFRPYFLNDWIPREGDKVEARAFAQAQGIPVIPGAPKLASSDDAKAKADAAGANVLTERALHPSNAAEPRISRTQEKIV